MYIDLSLLYVVQKKKHVDEELRTDFISILKRPTLLYKVALKSTGQNFVTVLFCFYLYNL